MSAHLERSVRKRRPLLAMLGSLLLLGSLAGPATAAPQQDSGKPDRGRDDYVAMGDSFASGVGTGIRDLDVPCYRSSAAYAPILDRERFDTALTFVACSGATTEDVRATQVAALSRKTDFVTLSVGGNDIGFARLVGTCVGGPDQACLAEAQRSRAAIRGQLPDQLDATYDAVRDRVRKAEVIVIGYPRFFAEDFEPCLQATGISAVEAHELNGLADDLDAAVGDRAAAAGFTYVSVIDSFTGHDICAATPWLNGAIGPTPQDVYHPTVDGYRHGFAPLLLEVMQSREPSRR